VSGCSSLTQFTHLEKDLEKCFALFKRLKNCRWQTIS